MQYTIRNVSDDIDRAARETAEREGVSLNEALLRALRAGLGVEAEPSRKRDLSSVFGKRLMDEATLQAIDEQQRVNPADWED